MEYHLLFLLLLPIILIFVFLNHKPKQTKLEPPGPRPWPIIGHTNLVGSKPHQSIAKLAHIYGPIMSLKLGRITTIVISSPEAAKDLFLKHDLTFSSRQVPHASTATNHDKLSMVWLPVCPKWRYLRKIAAIQLFTNQQLDGGQVLRRKKVDELIQFVTRCSKQGQVIDIGEAVFITTLNLMSNTFFSKDLCSYGLAESREFKDLFWEFMKVLASPNVSDYFPWLRWLDLQGIKRRSEGCYRKMLGFFGEIIDQRLRDPMSCKNDVLDTLLKLVDQKELSFEDVKHMLVDLFVAGTDTTSNTLEWTMVELLRHPNILTKAQTELSQVIGKDKLVQESCITKLPYLQSILKETFRLHPPTPFLLPHKAIENVELCNYHIPKGAQVWVNVWSIGRDPNIWSSPDLFSPERFLGTDIDIKGNHFELIPFGAGRRICPGLSLAYRMLHLILATLLHSFNWNLPNDVCPENMDIEEKFGITLQKIMPLKVIPSSRCLDHDN
uniref:CYP76 n=1 Tax=Mirabilis jalapa TaxID=3538 RepID=A0A0U2JM55_MIRJA|nr:CYP76 [Mirabilis jalapa]